MSRWWWVAAGYGAALVFAWVLMRAASNADRLAEEQFRRRLALVPDELEPDDDGYTPEEILQRRLEALWRDN